MLLYPIKCVLVGWLVGEIRIFSFTLPLTMRVVQYSKNQIMVINNESWRNTEFIIMMVKCSILPVPRYLSLLFEVNVRNVLTKTIKKNKSIPSERTSQHSLLIHLFSCRCWFFPFLHIFVAMCWFNTVEYLFIFQGGMSYVHIQLVRSKWTSRVKAFVRLHTFYWLT